MKIVADANILAVESSFNDLGELLLIPGREISPQQLIDADVLLVRSITAVNERLLKDTRVQLVASATSGCDHIDLDYLRDANIQFVDAKGCNANAVVDYCFTALAYAVVHQGLDLQASTVGIVGAGNVGGLLAKKLSALGIAVRVCDPPLAAESLRHDTEEDGIDYYSLDETLDCDVISLHVPLATTGDYPTRSLLNETNLANLRAGAVLIHSCRGSVVNERDLLALLKRRGDLCCIVDVWEDEPLVNPELAAAVAIATPHIAGYSQEAKLAATATLSEAVHRYCGKSSAGIAQHELLNLNPREILAPNSADSVGQLNHWELILQALPLIELSASFKASLNEKDAAGAFDAFRKSLSSRREFRSHAVGAENFTACQQQVLHVLGFCLS